MKEASDMRLRFWGVRGSVPAPGPGTVYYGGNTSCVEVRAGGQIIILDSGTGIRELGMALNAEFKRKPLSLTILITHTHWDHIQGFPFFEPAYRPKNRIQIVGFEGAKAGLAAILSEQMESPYFPIALKKLPGNIVITEQKKMAFRVGKVKVTAAFMNHPGVCVGYRLETEAGSMAYLPDNEPFVRSHFVQKQRNPKSTVKKGATEFAIAEDRKLINFVRDVDVLITDAQYDAEEYREHVGWGHGSIEDAVRLASRANVKKLYLFHHDPDHDDATISRMVHAARKSAIKAGNGIIVEAAREGVTCALPLDESEKPARVFTSG